MGTHQQLSAVANVQPRLLRHMETAERVDSLVLARTRNIEQGVVELARRGATDSDGLASSLAVLPAFHIFTDTAVVKLDEAVRPRRR